MGNFHYYKKIKSFFTENFNGLEVSNNKCNKGANSISDITNDHQAIVYLNILVNDLYTKISVLETKIHNLEKK
jgi:hypothetical protein